MPYSSYQNHYKDYRKSRQKTLPKRNPLKSIINPLTRETIELEWKEPRGHKHLDPEVSMFRSQQAANVKLRETYQKEITRLSKIIKAPLYINTDSYRGKYEGSQAFWKAASGQNLSLTKLFEKREEPYYDSDDHRVRNLNVLNEAPAQSFSTASYKCCPMSLVYRHADDNPWLRMVKIESIDTHIKALESYRERVSAEFDDFKYFYVAHEYDGPNWKHHIDDLSDDNPYKLFRLKFEIEVQKLRDQEHSLQEKLTDLQSKWDNYYCDEKNLEAEQDKFDKQYRQRSERREVLKSIIAKKRELRKQQEHEVLVALVVEEMKQWRSDTHNGKQACGCTSSPNGEGIRALKKHYSTLEDATTGAKNALINSDLHFRPYKCPVKKTGRDGRHYICGGYHLTKFA